MDKAIMAVIAVLSTILMGGAASGQSQLKPELIVTISAPETVKGTDIPITVRFLSATDKAVRIVDEFNNSAPLSYFLRFTVTDADGWTVVWPIGPMVSWSERKFRYAEVTNKKDFQTTVRLNEWLSRRGLAPGEYSVKLTYSNGVGEDCFKGEVDSAPIRIRFAEYAEPDGGAVEKLSR
jgi:hypothetical protein